MLGVTAEQCPKGGALTLNAISGIGMIAVGILGFPFIGALQEKTATAELSAGPQAALVELAEIPGILVLREQVGPEQRRIVGTECDDDPGIEHRRERVLLERGDGVLHFYAAHEHTSLAMYQSEDRFAVLHVGEDHTDFVLEEPTGDDEQPSREVLHLDSAGGAAHIRGWDAQGEPSVTLP